MVIIYLFLYHSAFYHLDRSHALQPKALTLQGHSHIVVNYLPLSLQIESNQYPYCAEINLL